MQLFLQYLSTDAGSVSWQKKSLKTNSDAKWSHLNDTAQNYLLLMKEGKISMQLCKNNSEKLF